MAGGFTIFRFGAVRANPPTPGALSGQRRLKTRAKGSPPMKLLNAATATGDGTRTLDMQMAHSKWGLQVASTGSPTAVKVSLWLSNDGVDWWKAGSWDSTTPQTSGDIVFFNDKPGIAAYTSLDTLTAGTSPTVSAWVCAY